MHVHLFLLSFTKTMLFYTQFFILLFLHLIHLLAAINIDTNGYIVYCPCMGQYSLQYSLFSVHYSIQYSSIHHEIHCMQKILLYPKSFHIL